MLKLAVIGVVLATSALALETSANHTLEISKDSSLETAREMLECWDTNDDKVLNLTELAVMTAGQQSGV